jgi:hypothetical protein
LQAAPRFQLKAAVSSVSVWSNAENEVVLKCWSLPPHRLVGLGDFLTLGWFAMTTMPALVGVFRGSARQIGGRAIQPSVRPDSCSYRTAWPFRNRAAVFFFAASWRKRTGDVIAGLR